MTSDELKALAERVMRLDGPDREVLKHVFAAIYPERVPSQIVASGYGWREDDTGWWLATGEDARVAPQTVYPPPYFTSLDAAMTLVPDGWVVASLEWWPVTKRASVTLREVNDNGWGIGYDEKSGDARAQSCTPALALTAAALLAKAAQIQGEGK